MRTHKEIDLELEKLLSLMKIERDTDLSEYKAKMFGRSLIERRQDGVCWYPVKLEKTLYDAGERLIVKISRNREHKHLHLFQNGKLISLFSTADQNTESEETITGVVNQVRDNEMTISINGDDFPDWIEDGKLGVQLLFDENSYKEMETAIKNLLSTKEERITFLKRVILGDEQARFNENSLIKNHYLNESQNRALNLVNNAVDLAIIHGPPGTGKTTTLIQTILHTLKNQTQVLVTAPSNAATDLLVEKLVEQGVSVLRIGHPARVNETVMNTTLDARITQHLSYKDLKTIRKKSEELHKMALKYKRNYGPEEREQRRLLLQEARKMNDEAKRLINYITDDIINKSRVIATTMVSVSNQILKTKTFDTVFIDEAAQGLEAATWIAILKAKRVILAGDHCQLPPTVKSLEAAKQGLERTLFEKAIQRNDAADVMLQEQYRMHKNIMEFSNRFFYNSQLLAHNSIAELKFFEEDNPLEFIDTAGCGYFEQTEIETHSTYNKEETQILCKHLILYIDELEHRGIFEDVNNIGIISPYKSQVKILQEIIANAEITLTARQKISINTVDSFQGQERDIIYISLVRSNEKAEIGFLADTRRMNVAMTRAKRKLVIFGDSATITSHKFYDNFIDYINEINCYKTAYEYIYL